MNEISTNIVRRRLACVAAGICAGVLTGSASMAQPPNDQQQTASSVSSPNKQVNKRRINMRSWKSVDDRRAATMDFAKFMKDPSNAEIRQRCIDDPKEAKRQFAIIGNFYLDGEQLPDQPPNDGTKTAIPQSVQFKVYDAENQKRQDLVVLVLPSAKGGEAQDATDIWIAAWPPWIGITP
jgi:hypothetical protein